MKARDSTILPEVNGALTSPCPPIQTIICLHHQAQKRSLQLFLDLQEEVAARGSQQGAGGQHEQLFTRTGMLDVGSVFERSLESARVHHLQVCVWGSWLGGRGLPASGYRCRVHGCVLALGQLLPVHGGGARTYSGVGRAGLGSTRHTAVYVLCAASHAALPNYRPALGTRPYRPAPPRRATPPHSHSTRC